VNWTEDGYSKVMDVLKSMMDEGFEVTIEPRIAPGVPEKKHGLRRDLWVIAQIACPEWYATDAEHIQQLRDGGITFDTGGFLEKGFVMDWYLDHSFAVTPQVHLTNASEIFPFYPSNLLQWAKGCGSRPNDPIRLKHQRPPALPVRWQTHMR
jgi:hypothetical protein